MSSGLHWEGISGLRLKLRPHITLHQHSYRGETWTVLHDALAPASFRFDQATMEFIVALDGQRSLDSVYRSLDDSPLGEDDIVALVAQLHAVDLVQGDLPVDSSELEARRARTGRNKWLGRLMSPTSVRIPLLDPAGLLIHHGKFFAPLFHRRVALLWGVLVGVALLLAMGHWNELANHALTRATDPLNLLLLLLVFPVIKLLHEAAHAIATRHWDGEVHEAGLMLLVFVPVPYVDASSSAVFENKWQRIAVSAAGIMVETTLAALALIVWLNVQPGLVSDLAFNVMLIGGVATVLFNGNPLLRFDGYYILSDLVEIPNLATRSARYLGYLSRRYLLRLEGEKNPVVAQGEPAWFVGYGLASFCYRIYISLTIALFISQKFFVLGVILALWVLGMQLVLPLLKLLRYLLLDASLLGRRAWTLGAAGSAMLIFVLLGTLFPVPAWTTAEGVVTMPDQAQVRAGTDGFVDGVLAVDGRLVARGEALFETSNRKLPVQLAKSRARLEELLALKTARLVSDRSSSGIVDEQINAVRAEIDQLEREQDMLQVRSPAAGRFRVAHDPDLEGRYLEEGALLGYVVTGADTRVRVVVPQTAIEWVRGSTLSVEARYVSNPGQVISGRVLKEVPAVGRQLPSPSLGRPGGGQIAVDARDPEGMTAMESIYFVDVSLPGPEGASLSVGSYVGSKVYIRFNHRPEPLLIQWRRSLRQLFLARLDV